jgi:hypothetical protein
MFKCSIFARRKKTNAAFFRYFYIKHFLFFCCSMSAQYQSNGKNNTTTEYVNTCDETLQTNCTHLKWESDSSCIFTSCVCVCVVYISINAHTSWPNCQNGNRWGDKIILYNTTQVTMSNYCLRRWEFERYWIQQLQNTSRNVPKTHLTSSFRSLSYTLAAACVFSFLFRPFVIVAVIVLFFV